MWLETYVLDICMRGRAIVCMHMCTFFIIYMYSNLMPSCPPFPFKEFLYFAAVHVYVPWPCPHVPIL